ncbi:MAG: glycine--tRNA ligase subunit beta [Alphaproteobacteria bacterium]|nr:glycine--tRNA ligase subunit beta [Alphaproteobacteria bacterium]
MATLLLELFSEEIPSRMQRGAAEQLQRLMLAGFEKNMLKPGEVKTFVSPRHLAIQCFGLPLIQPDLREEKRGPKIGAPEQAVKGFLAASGLALDQCEQRDGYYYATIERKGRAVADVAKEICENALATFSWPKSMRWGNRPLHWVRPLHRIACLLDDAVVPLQFAHLAAGNVTEGHRFLAPHALTIPHAEQYEAALRSANVVVDYAARRAQIKTEITALAAAEKLHVSEDEALLDEVTGLVEWPVPLLCRFDEKFLALPPEVLVSEMKTHQRYFALKTADGKLSDRFITVANMVTADGGAKVKEGNARVVRARLADGEFYWEQDRKTSLEDWGKKLSDVVFHAKVGMMDAKVARIEALAVEIASSLRSPPEGEPNHSRDLVGGIPDEASVRRAAHLCKADLTSGMVGEFPELQGIMGRYYATAQGESSEIADAIRDHYKPLGATDSVPETPLAAIVAIADKLDSIISLFAAGEKPTGSKDPLALRRAALGVLRIIDHYQWKLDLAPLVQTHESKQDVLAFLRDRLLNLMRESMLHSMDRTFVRHDVIEASLLGIDTQMNVVAITARARTLANWLATDSGKATLAAIKRSMNILAAEEKKDKAPIKSNPQKHAALSKPEEQKLWELVQNTGHTTLRNLEQLTAPINAFFEAVLVTEEGFREARLSLLAAVRDAANSIADFSKIEG